METGSPQRKAGRHGGNSVLSERVTTRFSASEMEVLRAKAKSVGKTESEFIRESVKKRVERYARRPMADGAVADYALCLRVRRAIELIRLALCPPINEEAAPMQFALSLELIEKEVGALEASLPKVEHFVDIPIGVEYEYPPFEEMH